MTKQEANGVDVTTGDTVLKICQIGLGSIRGKAKAG